ncbi:MAG: riboflavin biosynthesis protein RibF [candidate division WOR-3 bacterium]|nr:riboflavin biosynthesis protein RibF [candidate division WOR-3 bacterium]MDW8151171.1 riboflavin biosynthesis protein RibF [candidate division WOR-3 bacterium]
MIILNFDGEIKEKLCATVGTFDGLHLAHKFIINLTINTSKFLETKSAIFAFVEHIYRNKDLILTKDEKIEMLKKIPLDYLILLGKDTFSIRREEFLEILKKRFNVFWVVVGYNHRFGYMKEGNRTYLSEVLENFEFGLTIVPPIKLGNIEISSSNIRKFIKSGEIEIANKLLGYNFFIEGKVIKGKGLGKKIGFPTANIYIPNAKIIPALGIYASRTIIDNSIFYSVSYVGEIVENHIFDFNENIYDKQIRVEFLKKISDVEKFESIENLRKKIEKDILRAREFFRLKV